MSKFFSRRHPARTPLHPNSSSPAQDFPFPMLIPAGPGADAENPGDDESDNIERAKSAQFLRLNGRRDDSNED